MKKVGIIGMGFVGRAVAQISVAGQIETCPYDLTQTGLNSVEQKTAALSADFVFVCVPTPSSQDGQLDMSIVRSVVAEWKKKNSNVDSVLVIKSTVNPGFTDQMIVEHGDRIVFNPEFFTQRTHLDDFLNADEILVGGSNPDCIEGVLNLYRSFYHTVGSQLELPRRYQGMTALMAEMVKISRNSYYATKVSFMNELSELCGKMGIDYVQFREVFARQGRNAWVEYQHTAVPGPDGRVGAGGMCLPKDSLGLLELGHRNGIDMPVLEAAVAANRLRRSECYV